MVLLVRARRAGHAVGLIRRELQLRDDLACDVVVGVLCEPLAERLVTLSEVRSESVDGALTENDFDDEIVKEWQCNFSALTHSLGRQHVNLFDIHKVLGHHCNGDGCVEDLVIFKGSQEGSHATERVVAELAQ